MVNFRKHSAPQALLAAAAAALTLAGCASDPDGGNAVCGMAYNPTTGRTMDFAMGMGKPGTPPGSDASMMTTSDAGMMSTADGGAGDAGVTMATQAQELSAQARLGLQVNAFLDTSTALVKAATDMDAELFNTCKQMGLELGLTETDLAPAPGQSPTEAACVKAISTIENIVKLNLTVGAKLTIVFEPARCEIDASFTHTCIETCEQKEITETEVRCKPGKLSGECSATCTGQCSGSCSAQCTGQCAGTCTGQCMGTCKGQCNGECTLKNAAGECIGQCNGTCTGTCDATCMGSCSGTCKADCNGSCTGSCRGGCSVMYTAPKCEEIEIMRTVTECSQSCETEARCKAECTPPALTVDFAANLTAAQELEIKKAVATLRKHLPTIYKLAYRAGTVIEGSARAYKAQIEGFVNASADLTFQTAACLGSAVQAVGNALAQISLVATVSVNVSVSASAEGTASAGI